MEKNQGKKRLMPMAQCVLLDFYKLEPKAHLYKYMNVCVYWCVDLYVFVYTLI